MSWVELGGVGCRFKSAGWRWVHGLVIPVWEHRFRSFSEHFIVKNFWIVNIIQNSFVFLSVRDLYNSSFVYYMQLDFQVFFQKDYPNLWSFHNCLLQNFVHERNFICSNITFLKGPTKLYFTQHSFVVIILSIRVYLSLHFLPLVLENCVFVFLYFNLFSALELKYLYNHCLCKCHLVIWDFVATFLFEKIPLNHAYLKKQSKKTLCIAIIAMICSNLVSL